VEALAEAGGESEDAVVGDEDDYVVGGVEDGGTDLTGFQVPVDFGAQGRVHFAIHVGGDVVPNVFAVDPQACNLNLLGSCVQPHGLEPAEKSLALPSFFWREAFQPGRQLALQQGASPVESYFDGALGNGKRLRRFAHVHLFDVSQQDYVTVNLRQGFDGLAQDGAKLLPFQSLGGDFAPTCENGWGVVAGLVVGVSVERVFATGSGFAEPAQAFIAGDGENPGAELGVAAEILEILIDLDCGVLGGVFGLGLIAQQGHEEKEDGALAGPDQVVKQVAFAGEDAANTVCFELGVGGGH